MYIQWKYISDLFFKYCYFCNLLNNMPVIIEGIFYREAYLIKFREIVNSDKYKNLCKCRKL